MCAGAGRRSRFRRKVPEGSRRFRKVPAGVEASSGRFRRVPVYAGVGSGGGFRKVPKGWFRKVSEGSGGFWSGRVLVYRFRRQGSEFSGGFRRVPKSSGACWCRFRRQGSEGSGEFRCGLLLCNLDRSSHVIVLITGMTLSTWAKLLRKKAPPVVKDGIRHKDVYATAVGDTTKAYLFK